MTNITWLAEYAPLGQLAFRIGRVGDDVVAEWTDVARLRARSDGTDVRFEALPGARASDIAKLERGSARLLVRHLRGEIALHGSAVNIRRRTVVFLGRSGQGKSTLAAALCALSGATLVADDAIAIDRAPGDSLEWLVAPTETDHWLDAHAARALGVEMSLAEGDKLAVPATRTADVPSPLAAFVELVFDDGRREPRLSRLAGIDALGALVPHAVRFIVDDRERQREELEVLARLVEAVPTFRLERPRLLALLRPSVELAATLLDAPP